MFCPGMSNLADGRLLITGGSNAEVTSFYDPATNAFTKGPNMITPRGYQTSATLVSSFWIQSLTLQEQTYPIFSLYNNDFSGCRF